MFQIQQLEQLLGKACVKPQEPMAKHTTFRIGGPARWFIEPETTEELVHAVRYLKEQQEPYYIMGNGSNLLVSDAGVDGVVITTHSGKNGSLESVRLFRAEEAGSFFFEQGYCTKEEAKGKTLVYAGSGIMLAKLAAEVAAAGLTGLEFAGGIPGTLGGAVTMNAGAYGGEIRDVILSARVLDRDGRIRILKVSELDLSYRHSVIQKEEMIVLDALFALEEGDPETIRGTMRELNEKRREKQPLEYGSAGSTFKRPEGHFAGKLIQDAGLRGYREGDVMVSEKHCGFVVNVGAGTCEQADQVIKHVQKTVQDKFGVSLETEVKRWPIV